MYQKNFWCCAAVSCPFFTLGVIGRVMSAETATHDEARPVEDTRSFTMKNKEEINTHWHVKEENWQSSHVILCEMLSF